jgi:hypothetical protein
MRDHFDYSFLFGSPEFPFIDTLYAGGSGGDCAVDEFAQATIQKEKNHP